MSTKKPSRKDSWKKLGMDLADVRCQGLPYGCNDKRIDRTQYTQDCLTCRAKALRAATRKKGGRRGNS